RRDRGDEGPEPEHHGPISKTRDPAPAAARAAPGTSPSRVLPRVILIAGASAFALGLGDRVPLAPRARRGRPFGLPRLCGDTLFGFPARSISASRRHGRRRVLPRSAGLPERR